jgi:hypothetical protein
VHGDTGESRQHTELVDRDAAAGGVQVVGGQLVGAGHVQPLFAAGNIQAGLIDVHQVRQRDQRLDQRLDVDQRLRGSGEHAADPAGGASRPGHVGDQLGGPLDRDVLEHHQIAGERA